MVLARGGVVRARRLLLLAQELLLLLLTLCRGLTTDLLDPLRLLRGLLLLDLLL